MFSSLLIHSQYYPDAYHSQLCRHDVIHVVVAVDLGRVPGACANDPRDRENRGSATSRAAGLKKTHRPIRHNMLNVWNSLEW